MCGLHVQNKPLKLDSKCHDTKFPIFQPMVLQRTGVHDTMMWLKGNIWWHNIMVFNMPPKNSPLASRRLEISVKRCR